MVGMVSNEKAQEVVTSEEHLKDFWMLSTSVSESIPIPIPALSPSTQPAFKYNEIRATFTGRELIAHGAL